jgi:predicted transposase YdaD
MFGLSELKQTRVYQEAKEEGVQIGRQEGVQLGEAKLLIRQLSRRFGTLSLSQQERIAALSLEDLERLGEAFLDWQSTADFPDWLREG